MEAKKIFSKLNIKDYNNELEEILEVKLFSLEVKNLLLSMLYKIENAYKDYEAVKVEVLSIREMANFIIQTIKEKCFEIEFLQPNQKEDIKIDKKKGTIWCYPNEKSLLSAIWDMGQEDAPMVVNYSYTKQAMQEMLTVGSNINIVEVLRDFNGWSWDIGVKDIKDLKYNVLYQSLLLLDGKRLFLMNIDAEEKNSLLIQDDKKEFDKFFATLENCVMNLYKKDNKEVQDKIDKIKQEKEKQLELTQDKKLFVNTITNNKKQCLAQIDEIDKIINNTELLKKEYAQRNAVLQNKEKIFSISHLADRLEGEREDLLKQIQKYNKMLEPKEFIKEKDRIEKEVTFLQKEKNVIDCCKKCLECAKKQIEKSQEKSEIINWIYKIRYYFQIPFDEEINIKDVKELQKYFEDIIKLIIRKAQEYKVWDTFTENGELSYILIRELFESKIINFENINILCEYKKHILYVTYYDEDTLEMKKEFELENVKIKRKIKLFI